MSEPSPTTPAVARVLTIAGSDSGGGAGIQADLKAFARCGVHGMCAITAVTAQNTLAVQATHQIPPAIVLAQVQAVCEDIGVDAVKVGMLGDRDTALAVAHALDHLIGAVPVVVDPVMVAESGAKLLTPGAQEVLIERIVPRATVLTPNLPEARALASAPALDGPELARAVLDLGPDCVVLTGGHRDSGIDLFAQHDDPQLVSLAGERHPGEASHGSGCTHSAVLAAQLALGATPLSAARRARELAGEGVRRGLRRLGHGPGPVDVLGLTSIAAALD